MSRPSLLARALLIKETESKLTTAENILEEELRKWRGIRPMPGVPPASYMSAMSSRDMLMTTLERAQKEFHPVSPDEVMEAVVKAQHSGIQQGMEIASQRQAEATSEAPHAGPFYWFPTKR